MRQAFKEATAGKPVVLAFTNHDFRDIRPDVDSVRTYAFRSSGGFPGGIVPNSPRRRRRYGARSVLTPEPPCSL